MNPTWPKSFGTHSGPFHADEVTACALLLHTGQIETDRVVRTRDPARLRQCDFVADVGGLYDPKKKRFDHHQPEFTEPLASAGLVLRYLEEQKQISSSLAGYLRSEWIAGVDAWDIGLLEPIPGLSTFSQMVALFNPPQPETSEAEQDQAFQEAVQFALAHLQRLEERFREIEMARGVIEEAMAFGGPILCVEQPILWQDPFFQAGGVSHPAIYLIMPAGPHWKLRAIPPDPEHRMGMRHPLPASWAGLVSEELAAVSGVSGAVFCHKNRFVSTWETSEAAWQAAQIALRSLQEGAPPAAAP